MIKVIKTGQTLPEVANSSQNQPKVVKTTTTAIGGLFIGDKEVKWLPDKVYKSAQGADGL